MIVRPTLDQGCGGCVRVYLYESGLTILALIVASVDMANSESHISSSEAEVLSVSKSLDSDKSVEAGVAAQPDLLHLALWIFSQLKCRFSVKTWNILDKHKIYPCWLSVKS